MPDMLSRNVSRLRAAAASSLTTTAINRPSRNVTAATPRKLPRQPIVAVEKASGAVASRAPSVPIQQRPTEDQNPRARGACEHNGADDRDRGADHQANPRAESIERHAERNLHGGKRQKEDAGQQTDLSR